MQKHTKYIQTDTVTHTQRVWKEEWFLRQGLEETLAWQIEWNLIWEGLSVTPDSNGNVSQTSMWLSVYHALIYDDSLFRFHSNDVQSPVKMTCQVQRTKKLQAKSWKEMINFGLYIQACWFLMVKKCCLILIPHAWTVSSSCEVQSNMFL